MTWYTAPSASFQGDNNPSVTPAKKKVDDCQVTAAAVVDSPDPPVCNSHCSMSIPLRFGGIIVSFAYLVALGSASPSDLWWLT